MKKITLLMALVFSSGLMFAQVVLDEDFEAGLVLPTGWTNNDIAGGGEVWTFETGGEAIGFTDPNTIYYVNGEMDGNYAVFDSDGYGGTIAENAALESPVFNCTGLTSVTLTFNHFFTTGFGGQAFVEVTSDGTTWTQVAAYGPSNAFGLESIDVSTELSNAATAQVRFRWVGDFSWGWAFDNVTVFECTEAASPSAVTAPGIADGATNVTINSDGNALSFSWTEGGPATSFTLNLDTVSPPVLNAFTSFANGGTITGLAENTEYFWSVDAVNCAGVTPGPIWSFTTGAALSVEENELRKFSVYPNPTSDILNIKSINEIDNISVFNLLGQEVAKFETNEIIDSSINISDLESGLYLVKISAGDKTETLRVTKK
jgi:hypothetical protein